MDPEPNAASPAVPRSSVFALWVLVTLAILSPWPFGSVHPLAVRIITLITLLTAAGVGAAQAVRGGIVLPAVPLWPVLGFLALGAFQLVPLPPSLHALLAPGSYEVWHPSEPAAAAVLGSGFRPISVDPDATWRSLAFTTGLVTLALLAAPALGGPYVAFRAAVAVVLGGLAVSVYGVVARALFGPLLFGRYSVPTVSPFGPFVSKNHFAGYVEMTAMLALGLAVGLSDREGAGTSRLAWVRSPRASRVLLAHGAFATMALAILISLSRGGAVSLSAGCLCLFLAWQRARQRRRRVGGRRLWPQTVAGLAIAAGLMALLPREAHERLSSLVVAGREQSGSYRLDVWRDTSRMAMASPLVGQGLAAFADGFPRYKRAHGELRVEHAENDYIEMLVEGGGVGLGFALLAAAILFDRVVRGLRHNGDRLMRALGAGALAAVAALLVHSAVDFNLRIPSSAALFAFSSAVALGISQQARQQTKVSSWAVAGFSTLMLCSTPTVQGPPTSPGEARLRVAASIRESAARDLRLQQAEDQLSLCLRRHPTDAQAWLLLGWARVNRSRVAEGVALAEHALKLDPRRAALAGAVDRLRHSPRVPSEGARP